jgi:hypothetical protein
VRTEHLFSEAFLNRKSLRMMFAQTTFPIDMNGKGKDKAVMRTGEGIHTKKGKRNIPVCDPSTF